MNPASSDAASQTRSRPLPLESPPVRQSGPLTREELKEVLQALAIPFDLPIAQWRVTE